MKVPLSVTECKKYLPTDGYTDEEVEKIRDCLYQLAQLAIDDYFSKTINTSRDHG